MHPVRIRVEDDLRRARLTVLFRLLLAIPHFVWLILWSIAAFFATVGNWLATLVAGTPPDGLHGFLARYVRYATHLYAYLTLAANPYPGFTGDPESYPVDLEIDPPAPQRRLVTLFRLVLALPVLLLAAAVAGTGGGGGGGGNADYDPDSSSAVFDTPGLLVTVAFLGWFACLALGRMPSGFRNTLLWGLRYTAQVWAYVLILTDRYPNSSPWLPPEAAPEQPHPVRIGVTDDGRRSRLTVFFRLLLAIPHLVWILLWAIAALFAGIANWFATLVRGTPPESVHRFLAAFVRYQVHLGAFLFLVANPFPGFTGAPGYPVDADIPPPERQGRWITGFRLLLATPAFVVLGALGAVFFVAAVLGWFASLVTGRMPLGLRDVGAWVLRYNAMVSAYTYILTDSYPYSGPPVEEAAEPEEPALAAAAA